MSKRVDGADKNKARLDKRSVCDFITFRLFQVGSAVVSVLNTAQMPLLPHSLGRVLLPLKA